MPITYLEGDATEPRKSKESDCPCLLSQDFKCGPKVCYHHSGEGVCNACLFSSGLTAESMTVKQLMWYLGRMFGVEIRPIQKKKRTQQKPTLFKSKR